MAVHDFIHKSIVEDLNSVFSSTPQFAVSHAAN